MEIKLKQLINNYNNFMTFNNNKMIMKIKVNKFNNKMMNRMNNNMMNRMNKILMNNNNKVLKNGCKIMINNLHLQEICLLNRCYNNRIKEDKYGQIHNKI